jgi:AraC family transcriptional regulator
LAGARDGPNERGPDCATFGHVNVVHPVPVPGGGILPVKPLETLLFESTSVGAGTFRCAVDHPLFADSGPCSTYCFVFPRTHVWIRHLARAPFLGSPNLVTLYNEGQLYARRPASPDGDRSDWFAVAPRVIEDALGTIGAPRQVASRRLFVVPHLPSDARMYLTQRQLIERLESGARPDPLQSEEIILWMLGTLLRRASGRDVPASETVVTTRRRRLVDGTKALLSRWLGRRVELAELATALDCSVFHLCRVFRDIEGTTIHAYQSQLRLRTALERLVWTECQEITPLALDLGYCSHSHFTSAFRRAFGLTPSAFLHSLASASTARRRASLRQHAARLGERTDR